MEIVTFNLSWMAVNVLLALAGVILGVLFLKSRNVVLKIIFLFLWLLFVPNTIYLLTDIQYFPEQWIKLGSDSQVFLIIQYLSLILLGVLTFIFGLYPLEKFLTNSRIKKNKKFIILLLIIINYVMAFAVALGKLERVNSWDIFIDPNRVINSSLDILSSSQIIVGILLFGSLGNAIYFSIKRIFKI